MSGLSAAVVVGIIVALLMARVYATRRFAATGAAWSVWVRFGMPVFIGALVSWIGLTWFERSPVVAVFLVTLGLAQLYLGWRYIQSVVKSVAAVSTPEGRADATFSSMADYMLGLVGLMLLTGVVVAVLALTGVLR